MGVGHFLLSAPELDDTKKFPIRYVSSMWQGINFETFDFAETGAGPVGKSFDLFGDGTIELVNIPGHTSGLAAMKISNGDNLFYCLQTAATLKNRGVKKFRPVLPLTKIWR